MKALLMALLMPVLIMGWTLVARGQVAPPVDMEQIAKDIENSPIYDRARQVARDIEEELNRQVEEMVAEKKEDYNAIYQRIIEEAVGPAPIEKEQDAIFDEHDRIYIFISRSVPLEVLKSYAAAIDTLGNENIRLVFRAFPRNFLDTFLRKSPDCTNDDCVTKAKIKIGRRLFSQYDITRVPAVVYDPGPEDVGDDWVSVYGAAPLSKVLNIFYRELGKEALKIAAHRVARK